MEKRDTFPFGAVTWRLVDEAKPGGAATLERAVEIVDREADVMDAWTTFGDELADGRVGMLGFEQLDERVAGLEAGDAGSVRIGERDLGHAEEIAIEGQDLVERTHGDPHVGDAGRAAGRHVGHGSALVKRGAGAEF